MTRHIQCSNTFWVEPIYSLWNRYGVHTESLNETPEESDFSSIEEMINEGELDFSEFCEFSQLNPLGGKIKCHIREQ